MGSLILGILLVFRSSCLVISAPVNTLCLSTTECSRRDYASQSRRYEQTRRELSCVSGCSSFSFPFLFLSLSLSISLAFFLLFIFASIDSRCIYTVKIKNNTQRAVIDERKPKKKWTRWITIDTRVSDRANLNRCFTAVFYTRLNLIFLWRDNILSRIDN